MPVALCCRLIEGLKILKRSPYYRRLRPELQAPFPADAWHDEEWAFFVFDLHDGEAKDSKPDGGSRLVIFAVNLKSRTLESVKLITIHAHRKEASVENLQSSEEQYIVLLPPDW